MIKRPEPDWYLQQWCEALDRTQADMTRDLEMHKNTGNRVWHSVQPYRRDFVNQIAAWLNIRPYELLMPPEEAMAIRRLRESAARIVHDAEAITPPAEETRRKTG